MLSLSIKDMISSSFEKQNKQSELGYLLKIKQDLLRNTRIQNERLSEQLRDCKEESRQLKITFARTVNKKAKLISAHQAEIDELQKSISELKIKNQRLENSTSKPSTLESDENSSTKEENDYEKNQSETTEATKLKFTPEFQAMLDQHSKND